jgi:3'-5' exoribonuclease
LFLELFDGTNTITGNYWDWTSGNKPDTNTIVDITAQVTEWQSAKQLNVKSMSANTTARLEDFAPSSGYDIGEIYKKAYALMSDVMDDELRTVALSILEEAKELWITVPAAARVHHNYIGGTLLHSYNVAIKAKALAEVTEGANVDLATVGGMLHDVGKLFTYRVNGVVIDTTANGRLYEHIFIGAEFVGNFAENHVDCDDPYIYGKIRLLRHIILSHHGILEFGSPVTPQCIEAYIVHHADSLDAAAEQIKAATLESPEKDIWTEKLWALSNRQHLTTRYVDAIMHRKTV